MEGFEPTAHEPGSQGKIEVMARRLELGQPLHHPHDCNELSRVSDGMDPRFSQEGQVAERLARLLIELKRMELKRET